MWTARLRTYVIAALAAGITVSLVASAQPPTDGRTNAPATARRALDDGTSEASRAQSAPREAGASRRRDLLERRIEAAREIVRLDLERAVLTVGSEPTRSPGPGALLQIASWSRRLMADRLDLATTSPDRLATIREHRQLMLRLESILNGTVRNGNARPADGLKKRYYRLEADQLLTEAGGDPAQEPPAAGRENDPEQPPSVIPSAPPPTPRPGDGREPGAARSASATADLRSQRRRALLERRVDTAREIIRLDLDRLRVLAFGSRSMLEILEWSRRLMEDRLALAATPAERLTAIREHRDMTLLLEAALDEFVKARQARPADALKGRYYRQEADQLLAEAGADPAKEPPVAEPRANPAPPPPTRPSPTPLVPR